MKKSELRKFIRQAINEQFGGGNTMTANCSQYNFPMGNIATAQWCENLITGYDSNFFPQLLTPWCNGEASNQFGAFPQGFIDMMGTNDDINQCGMCHCIEPMNTSGPQGKPGTGGGIKAPFSGKPTPKKRISTNRMIRKR